RRALGVLLVLMTTCWAGLTAAPALAQSPPSIAMFFGASQIAVGGTTSLTFDITNSNPAVDLTGVGFDDDLPAGLEVASRADASDSCGGSFAPNPGDITLSLSGG